MHKDRYIILQASTFTEENVDPDLFFDRFRWAELSLGFSYTGDSDGKVIPLSLGKLMILPTTLLKICRLFAHT